MIAEFLSTFRLFNDDEIAEAMALFKPRSLAKGDFFVREGAPCTEIAFICSGIVRSFYLTGNGDETTFCFRFPNELLAAYSSLITGNGSREHMQAITPVELLVVRKETLSSLIAGNPKWVAFLKTIAEQEYVGLETRFFQLQRDSALQRYTALLNDQPEYVQTIPLKYLATYLGITQRHLSRIRKEIGVAQ